MEIVNVTDHPLVFDSNEIVMSHGLVRAERRLVQLKNIYGDEVIVQEQILPTKEGKELLRKLREQYPEALFVGSYYSAVAYEGKIVRPIPTRESINKRPEQRVYRRDKFLCYSTKYKHN